MIRLTVMTVSNEPVKLGHPFYSMYTPVTLVITLFTTASLDIA